MRTTGFLGICLVMFILGFLPSPASAAPPIQTFPFTDVVGNNWSHELVFRTLNAAIPTDQRNQVVLVKDGVTEVPFQWVDTGSSPQIAFLVDLPAYGQTTYALLWQTPATPTNPLQLETLAQSLRLNNGITGVEIPTDAGPYTNGPLMGIRMRSGRWVAGSQLTGTPAITSYTTQVKATGPVFADVQCTYQFGAGKTWVVQYRVIAGEPVVLVEETCNLADSSRWNVKLDTNFAPTHAFFRPTEGAGVAYKGSLGQNSVFPLYYDGSDPTPLTLCPWVAWWSQTNVAFFGIFHCPPGVSYTRGTTPPGMVRNPPVLPSGEDDDMLIVAAGYASTWAQNAMEGGKTYCPVQAATDGSLTLQLPLYGSGRCWLLGSTSVTASIVPDASNSEPQRLMNKYCETSLQDVLAMQLDWVQNTASYPNLILSKAEVTAYALAPGFSTLVDKNPDGSTRDFKKLLMPVVAGQPFSGTSAQWEAFRTDVFNRLNTTMGWFRVGNNVNGFAYPSEMYGILVPRVYIGGYLLPQVDLALGADLFTPEEQARVLGQLAFIGYKIASPNYISPERGFAANPGMTTQWCCGLGQLGCELYNHPQAAQWVNVGLADSNAMLDTWQGPNGGWLEAPHYWLNALQAIATMQLAAYHAGVLPAIYDERMARTTLSLAKICSPPDPNFGNLRHFPPLGNTYRNETTEIFGMLAKYYRNADPQLADQLQWMWRQQGLPYCIAIGGQSDLDFYREFLVDATQNPAAPPWTSEAFPGFGAVLHNGYPGTRDTYMVYHQGQVAQAHYDNDQGSFELWGKGRPLCLDWGYRGCMAAYMHNRMDVGGSLPGTVNETALLAPADYLHGRQDETGWDRQILFVKDADPLGPTYYVCRDSTSGTGSADWRLWINTDKTLQNPVTVAGAVAHAVGEHDVDLDVWFGSPASSRLGTLTVAPATVSTVTGFLGGGWSGWDDSPLTQQGLQLPQPKGEPLVTVLYPRLRTEQAPVITEFANGKMLKVVHAQGTDYVFLSLTPFDYNDGTIKFSGTAGVIQRRGSTIILTLNAAGIIGYGTAEINSGTPQTLTVTVGTLPDTVYLNAPTNGRVYTIAPARVELEATPSNIAGTTRMEFYNGTNQIGEDTSYPYTFTWNSVAIGTYSLTAKAYNSLGGVVTSQTVNIEVNNSQGLYPILHLTFDESGGATTADVTGNGHTGTLYGNAVFTTDGKLGNGLLLDGDGDYVKVPETPELDFTGHSFSFALWVSPTAGGERYSFAKGLGGNKGWGACNNTDSAAFRLGDSYSSNYYGFGAFTLNVWQHWVITVDVPNRQVKTYVNGALSSTYSIPAGINLNDINCPGNWLSIGCRTGGYGVNAYPVAPYFQGRLDEFYLFGKVLSAAEADYLYTSTNQCSSPSFTPPAGTYGSSQSVTISIATVGASIRYTTDGSMPTSTTGNLYSGPVAINSSCTLKAIAYKSGMADSSVTSGVYTIPVATPTFNPAAGSYIGTQSVTISTTTTGATIRYTTDGSTPSQTNGLVNSTPVNISATTTLKAIAYKSGMADSAITSGIYTIQVAAPTFNPAAGNYISTQSVTISTTTTGATIRYTTDGSTPSQTIGSVYSSPVNISATTTLKAIAYKSGMADSAITSGIYTIQVAAPTFNPVAGSYIGTQSVTISTTTTGATIRYTTDGSTPTSTTGTLYSGSVTISSSCTLKAIAYKSGLTDSSVTSGTYTIQLVQVAAPTFSPAAGNYGSAQSVTISTTTTGASIRYTTDGSTPTSTTGTLYSGPVTISSSCTLKAIAYKSGMTDSVVTSGAYIITPVLGIFTNNQDIGAVGVAGSAGYANPTYTVKGAGAGVTGPADACQFVYKTGSGNFTITARVASFSSTNANARAGVMIRQNTTANGLEASTLFSPSVKKVFFHRRTFVGGATSTDSATAAVAPYWVRLVKNGSKFTAYMSANGTSWKRVGSVVNISISGTLSIGLAVTSGSISATATATFDNVTITQP